MTEVKQTLVDLIPDMPELIRTMQDEEAQKMYNIIIRVINKPENNSVSIRIGVGKGKIVAPDDFDAGNEEIAAYLMENAL